MEWRSIRGAHGCVGSHCGDGADEKQGQRDGLWKETFSRLANFESVLVRVLFGVAVAAPAWHLLK